MTASRSWPSHSGYDYSGYGGSEWASVRVHPFSASLVNVTCTATSSSLGGRLRTRCAHRPRGHPASCSALLPSQGWVWHEGRVARHCYTAERWSGCLLPCLEADGARSAGEINRENSRLSLHTHVSCTQAHPRSLVVARGGALAPWLPRGALHSARQALYSPR